MKLKLLNLALIITSLFGYMEWGGNNHMFLFEAEAELLKKAFINPLDVLHPFTILPFIGQMLLIISLFYAKPSKYLTFIGMLCIGILMLLLFLIGILNLSLMMLACSLPFIIVSVLVILANRKQKQAETML